GDRISAAGRRKRSSVQPSPSDIKYKYRKNVVNFHKTSYSWDSLLYACGVGLLRGRNEPADEPVHLFRRSLGMRLTPSLICLGLFSAIACWPAEVDAQAVSQVEPASPKPAPAARPAKSDAWRYAYHQGRWWYWQPSNSWVYYQDRRWIAYDARSAASAIPARRYESGYRGAGGLNDARHWPHGANGSDPNASIHAGGATFHAARPAG